MPRITLDLPARDLEDIEAMTRDGPWPNTEAAVRYMVADYLEVVSWTPEYAAFVKAKVEESLADDDEGRDMDEVFDELEAQLSSIASKAS